MEKTMKKQIKQTNLLLFFFIFFIISCLENPPTDVSGDFGTIEANYRSGFATNYQISLDKFSPQDVLKDFNQFKLTVSPELPPSTEIEFNPLENILTFKVFSTLLPQQKTEYSVIYSVDNKKYKGGFKGKIVLVGNKDSIKGELKYSQDKIAGLIDSNEELAVSLTGITEGSQNKADYTYSIARKDGAKVLNNVQIGSGNGVIALTKGVLENNGVYIITAKATDSNTHLGSLTKEITIDLVDKPSLADNGAIFLKDNDDAVNKKEADLIVITNTADTEKSKEGNGNGEVSFRFGQVHEVRCSINLNNTVNYKLSNGKDIVITDINSAANWKWSIARKDGKKIRTDYVNIDNTGLVAFRKGSDIQNEEAVYIVTATAIDSVQYKGFITAEVSAKVKQVQGIFSFERIVTNVAGDGVTKTEVKTQHSGVKDADDKYTQPIEIFRGGTNTYAFLAKINLDSITLGSKNINDYIFKIVNKDTQIVNKNIEIDSFGFLKIKPEVVATDSQVVYQVRIQVKPSLASTAAATGFIYSDLPITIKTREFVKGSLSMPTINVDLGQQATFALDLSGITVGSQRKEDYDYSVFRVSEGKANPRITMNNQGVLTVANTATTDDIGSYIIRADVNLKNTHGGALTLQTTVFIRNFDFKFVKTSTAGVDADITSTITTNLDPINAQLLPRISLKKGNGAFSKNLPDSGLTYVLNAKENELGIGGISINAASGVISTADFVYDKVKAIKSTYTVTLLGDNKTYFGSVTKEIDIKSIYIPTVVASQDRSGMPPALGNRVDQATATGDTEVATYGWGEHGFTGNSRSRIDGTVGATSSAAARIRVQSANVVNNPHASEVGMAIALNANNFLSSQTYKITMVSASVSTGGGNGGGVRIHTRAAGVHTEKATSTSVNNVTIEKGRQLVFYVRNASWGNGQIQFGKIVIDPQ